ncbi:MAG: hypothetical protein AB1705_26830 [Verrucomicrobiota bacterium]
MNRLLFACLAALTVFHAAAAPLELPKRWIYVQQNLYVDKNIDDLQKLFERAAGAGYTGAILADSKFSKLGDMDARYHRNLQRVKQISAATKIEVIPTIFSIGYSNDLLWHDPNLAEALPVKEALFVVQGGVARLQADPAVVLKGGDMNDFKQWGWVDKTVGADNGAARTTNPNGENARLSQKLRVSPFRQYHLSVRIKTQDFRGNPEIKAIAGGRVLTHSNLGVKPTQDWTEHHAVFNSLENTEVQIYLGVWGGRSGTVWWDDAKVEEVGLLNLVRRAGAPLAVRREGGAALVEGKDFQRVEDPLMGSKPWKGEYTVYHQPPAIKTSLPDGTRLRVSYYHTVTIHDGQVMICPSEPRTVELLRDQARRLHAAWGAKGYMMSHDEIRVLNWCAACQKRNLDAGALLADNARTCVKILREVNPGGDIYVWNDMFDPHHNAHKDYYLVRGDLAGSWEGLDQDVIIVPWYFSKRDASLKFFADRGHRMIIAGYYDSNPANVLQWLDAAAKVKGVEGVMYTTWQRNFNDLEKFAEHIRSRQK